MKSGDLLGKLGAKTSAEGTGKTEPNKNATANSSAAITSDGNSRGADMLSAAATKTAAINAQAATEVKTNSAAPVQEEPAGNSKTEEVDNGSWTSENMMKEIKKLREENKMTRIKYSEAIEKLKVESDTRVVAKEQELQELSKAKEELEQIKAKEEDRKRDLSEKLAHREALVAEIRAKYDADKKASDERLRQYQAQVEQYKAEHEAQLEVYKQRLNNELASIPEKYQDIANLLVKGAGDSRDALVALSEAKIKGLFDEKSVIVSHSVPGAADGARASKEKLDAAAQAQREKMASSDKIKQGLKAIRSGETNSAFRIR